MTPIHAAVQALLAEPVLVSRTHRCRHCDAQVRLVQPPDGDGWWCPYCGAQPKRTELRYLQAYRGESGRTWDDLQPGDLIRASLTP